LSLAIRLPIRLFVEITGTERTNQSFHDRDKFITGHLPANQIREIKVRANQAFPRQTCSSQAIRLPIRTMRLREEPMKDDHPPANWITEFYGLCVPVSTSVSDPH
jgi:hypothetical protein